MRKKIDKDYPGPQKALPSFNRLFFCLFLLTAFSFGLTIYAVLKSNSYFLTSPFQKYFSFEILDTKTASTIFVTFISLLLVRHQFVIGFKPKIIYECKKTKTSVNPELDHGGILWQVKIRNVGLGTAIFSSYVFRVGLLQVSESDYNKEFTEIIEELKTQGLYYEEDYYLSNITNGYAMPSKDERILFEVRLPNGYAIKQIDVKMVFSGYLGGKYHKEVYLIPRRGIFKKEPRPISTDDAT